MMIHKAEGKLNKTGFRNTVGVTCMVCTAVVYVWIRSFTLYVQAAPATLTSSDATVYEQADEGSSPAGSLVEGSTFEYIGDVTAEDGSVWHQIRTSSGVNGYIRGDKEIEITAEEAALEEQGGQEASNEEGEGVSAENEPAGGGEEAGEALEENADEDEELSEEGEDLEGNDIAAGIMNMQNNQAKKYVLNPTGKVKERESFADLSTEIQNEKRTGAGIDSTLLIGIAVVLFCVVTVHICLTRMRMFKYRADGEETLAVGKGRSHRKPEKKKHSQKRRTKKVVQNRKEGGKAPKEKEQRDMEK